MKNKSIAINVITWNDWQNTVVCLESILQSDYDNFDIILIDNNSEEKHIQKIKEWAKNNISVEDDEFNFNPNKTLEIIEVDRNFKIKDIGKKNIYLIKNKTNLGLTAGLNIGYKFSNEQGYDYISRVDCDFIITKQFLKKMVETLNEDKDIVAVSPKVKHAYLRDTIWWAGIKFNWFYLKFQRTMNLKKKRIYDSKSYSGLIETDGICGCCSFYRPEILKKVGYGDEEFFFGPEDTELSFRLKKFGKLIVNLDAYTFHKIATSTLISGWYERTYNETIGFLLLIKKTGSILDKIIGYSYFLMRIPYFYVLMKLNIRNKEKVSGFFKGCVDFFLNKHLSRKKN